MDEKLERDLVLKAKKDPEAFGVLFDFYYPIIYKFVFKRVGNIDLAQDITSEIFFQVLKNLWRFRFKGIPFKSWLFKIALVQIAKYYKMKSKYLELTLENIPQVQARESSSADYEIKIQEQVDLDNQVFEIVHKAMLNLSENQYAVVSLRFFEKKKIREIAKILSMNENTVKSHLRRGLLRLSKILNVNDNIREYAKAKFRNYRKIFEQNI